MSSGHDPYAALRCPDYRRILTVNVLGAACSGMQFMAVEWEIYQRTNRPGAIGLIGLVQFLPVLLLVIPAGHLADRMSRKWLFAAAHVLMTTASVGLAIVSSGDLPTPLFYGCLLLVGVGRAFAGPARSALIPQVVPPESLGNAVTWNTSGWQVATTVGPAIAGWVIATSERAGSVYVLAAGGYALGTLLVVLLRPRPVERKAEPVSVDSLLAGLKFVWRTPLILATITLDLLAVLVGGVTALLPVFAQDILQVGPTGFGWLRAAPPIGALVTALILAHRPPLRRAGRSLLQCVAGFGVVTIAFGFSTDPVLSFVLLAVTGALDNVSMVVRGTLMQLLTPDAMRGRVSAVNLIFVVTSNELGAVESGMMAELVGTVPSVVGGGIGTLFVVAWVAVKWPQVLRLGPLYNPTGALYSEVAEAEVLEEKT